MVKNYLNKKNILITGVTSGIGKILTECLSSYGANIIMLSKNEAVLVEVGSNREFSPSDNRLQDKFNVRRPRMSQMCNRLYRAGILSVQQKGRTRMFKLTNDARAQLIAWGMMEAVV